MKLGLTDEEVAEIAYESLIDGTPDERKIKRIVKSLDTDGNGSLSAEELKVLFGRLFALDPTDIPDDHEAVVQFVGLSIDAMVTELSKNLSSIEVLVHHGVHPKLPNWTIELLTPCLVR